MRNTIKIATLLMISGFFTACQQPQNTEQVLADEPQRKEVMQTIVNNKEMMTEMVDMMMNNEQGKMMMSSTFLQGVDVGAKRRCLVQGALSLTRGAHLVFKMTTISYTGGGRKTKPSYCFCTLRRRSSNYKGLAANYEAGTRCPLFGTTCP